jgi:5'-3' exonuclease
MVDFKALMGDPSDNIPGVAGVGEKTALDLIRRYGAIDNIYSDIESLEVTPSVKKKTRGRGGFRKNVLHPRHHRPGRSYGV